MIPVPFNSPDDRNQLKQVTLPETTSPSQTHVSKTYYDQVGNVVKTTIDTEETGTDNRPVVTVYDSRNRVDSVEDANGSETRSFYDYAGNVVTVIDAEGNRSRSSYNVRNQLIRTTDPLGYSTVYAYDARGSQTKITDPNENEITSTYDGLRRLHTQTESEVFIPLSTSELAEREWTYDANGNILSITDLNGRVRSFTYDSLNRRTQESWSGVARFTFSYDAVGNQLSVSDLVSGGGGNATFTYDYADRVTSATTYNPLVLNYQYDLAGNRTALKEGSTTTRAYDFDELNRLKSVTSTLASGFGPGATSYQVTFGYNMASQLTSVSRPLNGVTYASAYAYDVAGRLAEIEHTSNASSPNTMGRNYLLTRDNNGRVLQIDDEISGTKGYAYDQSGQLVTSAQQLPSSTLSGDVTRTDYDYDANGNRVGDDYTTVEHNRVDEDPYFTDYTYDNEGNVLTRVDRSTGHVQRFDWDHRNRLIRFRESNSALTSDYRDILFTYDGLDRRVVKNSYDKTGPSTVQVLTGYVYDGSTILGQYEWTGSAWTRVRNYLHAVDQVLAEEKTGDVQWLFSDQLGSIRDIRSAASAANHWELDYDSFGQPTAESRDVAIAHLYGYAGGEFDGDSGLNHFGARYYDPANGRFLSTDPIDADINGYRYGGNDPINSVDLSGLQRTTPTLGQFEQGSIAQSFGNFTSSFLSGLGGGFGSAYVGYLGASDVANSDSNFASQAWARATAVGGDSRYNPTDNGWLRTTLEYGKATGLGLLQGGANIVNGVQDAGIGIANLAPLAYNYTAGFVAPNMGYIPSPDWSKDLVIQDDPTHGISKFIGGQSAFTLLTMGASQLGTPVNLAHVTSPSAATSIASQQVIRGSNGIFALSKPSSVPFINSLRTLGAPGSTSVPIPAIASQAFKPIVVHQPK